ncbi:MAG: hypothetical protein DMG59_02190 [Acidobacteria bacterium]|jgi:hypothetical protein|nr:MAG: hypothetical protein DMG59_02190 [Acidobacteriota bacterium]
MFQNDPTENPGVIQARLAYLRRRKAVLDELIFCLERYSVYELPMPQTCTQDKRGGENRRRIAGMA